MNNQGETDRLILAVKLVMKKNRVRHADLAKALKLSIPTMKRILSRGPLSMERLMQICDALEIGFYELVEIAKEKSSEALKWMSVEQEDFLLKNPDATEYLIRIMNGATPEQIQAEVELSDIRSRKYLTRLETAGLIIKSGTRYKVSPPGLARRASRREVGTRFCQAQCRSGPSHGEGRSNYRNRLSVERKKPQRFSTGTKKCLKPFCCHRKTRGSFASRGTTFLFGSRDLH